MGNFRKIRAGWLIDGSGAPARRNMLLVIRDGRIHYLGSGRGAEPAGDTLPDMTATDLTAATLLPGLVDSHVHLNLPGSPAPASSDRPATDSRRDAFLLISQRLGQYFSHGILGVRDGGDRDERAGQFKRDGAVDERPPVAVRVAGKAFYMNGRYGGFIGRAVSDGNTLADAVRLQAPVVDHIKIINSGLNSLRHFGRQTPGQFTRQQLRAAVTAAAAADRTVMVHANGRLPVGDALDAGCRSIEHGYFMGRENLMKMSDCGVTWVPTAMPIKACADCAAAGSVEADVSRRTLDHQLEQMALARQWGVRVAVGTDAGCPGVDHGTGLVEELKLFISAGYTIEEAIACASAEGAGLTDFSIPGRLAVGDAATFVVAPGAPDHLPQSLNHILHVYVNGMSVFP